MQTETKSVGKRILAALPVLNFLALIIVIAYLAAGPAPASGGALSGQLETGEKYILYIGTNDKETYTQLIPTEEARETVDEICAKYTGGYTESDARGGWTDETGTLTRENTLVYEFYQIEEETLVQIMDEILAALNQNSILVEKRAVSYTYYSGGQNGG